MRSIGRFRPGAGVVLSYYYMILSPNEQFTLRSNARNAKLRSVSPFRHSLGKGDTAKRVALRSQNDQSCVR